MSWLYLSLAIVFETIGTAMLKLSNGFSLLLPSIGAILGYIFCFLFLSYALKTIDVSIAYAIWGALGIFLISAIGIIFFHESATPLKLVSILFIILGTIGLRLSA